PNLQTQATTAS
ncbi:hypothetical protein CFOL_v3_08227, partial [Cephalotus follicularis]